MIDRLIDRLSARLSSLPPGGLTRNRPARPDEIAEIETRIGITLPEDLRRTLEWTNGFELSPRRTNFILYNAHDLAWTSSEPHFAEWLPSMFLLGTDGEGGVYYADPGNRLGRGAFAVYHVDMGSIGFPHSHYLGPSFEAAVTRSLGNESFYDLPELGDEPGFTSPAP